MPGSHRRQRSGAATVNDAAASLGVIEHEASPFASVVPSRDSEAIVKTIGFLGTCAPCRCARDAPRASPIVEVGRRVTRVTRLVRAASTVSSSVVELELKFLAVARSAAVTVCQPTARSDVAIEARSEPSGCTGAPRSMPLSSNSTVPVGVPPPGATTATSAVKVTPEPNSDGFADEDSVVLVSAGLTICGRNTVPTVRSPLELWTSDCRS